MADIFLFCRDALANARMKRIYGRLQSPLVNLYSLLTTTRKFLGSTQLAPANGLKKGRKNWECFVYYISAQHITNHITLETSIIAFVRVDYY